jgi:2-phospho-L-lactate/phosphoenolpyruvate guanylyltransferase
VRQPFTFGGWWSAHGVGVGAVGFGDRIAAMTDGPENAQTAVWSLVLPVKRLDTAKSRLRGPAAAHRAALALAFAADTAAAALATVGVGELVVVTDDPAAAELTAALGAHVVEDKPGAGLNAALTWGATVARQRAPHAGIAALSADLPALRTAELAEVLEFAAAAKCAVVVGDAHGSGSTAYLAAAAVPFIPAFGADSLQAHLAGGAMAFPGAGVPSVRQDVDTVEDLWAAVALGVGPRTTAVVQSIRF